MHLPALGFVRVPGKEVRPLSGSLCNPIEARAIASWIHTHHDRLVEHYKSIGGPETIENIVAVVTPYALQKTEIAMSLKDLGVMAPITVGTVHALQGAERPVVLFSAVNSKESSPHVRTKPSENCRGSRPRAFWDKQSNILNVAVSRAKDSFILFSDMSHFKPDDVGSPSGTLARILDEKEDSEISMDLTSAISKAISKSYPVHEMQGVTIQSVSTLEEHRSVLARAFDQGLGAQSEVILTSPWIERAALEADAILDLVRSATSRGVVVRIFTDRLLNEKRRPVAFPINVKSLQDAGATVEVVSRLHCKVLYVDDWLKCVGSFNWLSASRDRSFSMREVSTLVEGAAF
ncbi:MAG: hypothetical protein EBZ48_17695, partial [Proteobacteria bacterium]|nr:hypothetical protein [Pseudomonadota bacterium]